MTPGPPSTAGADDGKGDARLHRVASAWARQAGAPEEAHVQAAAGAPIVAGSQAAAIDRYRLEASHGLQSWESEVVIKDTWYAELVALRTIAGRSDRPDPLPELIDGDTLPAGDLSPDHPLRPSWVAVASYAGSRLPLGPLPLDLAEALAWLHTGFLGSTSGIDSVIGIDAGWFRRSLVQEYLLPQWGFYPDRTVADEVAEWLSELVADELIDDALNDLPRTLLHGDVHNGNILVDDSGRSVLIDWANARLGPPLVDLANVTTPGSPAMRAYLNAFERAAGPRPPRQVEVEFAYARLQVNTQYLGTFLSPDGARAMVGRARQARAELRKMLT